MKRHCEQVETTPVSVSPLIVVRVNNERHLAAKSALEGERDEF